MIDMIRAILLPGLVLQSVLVGGAYSTGREIVQYFTRFGLSGGLYAMAFTFIALWFILLFSFEFARVSGAYDYRSFFRRLIGRGWWLFEVLTIVMLLLVLSVGASAAGEAVAHYADGSTTAKRVGQATVLAGVTVLAFFGREAVMRSLGYWAVFTTAVFAILSVTVIVKAHGNLGSLQTRVPSFGETTSGLQYAFYSISSVPLLLYCTRDIASRRQAVIAALAAAVLIMTPAVLIHFATSTALPGILARPLPVYALLERYMGATFMVTYSIVLVGTLIGTGVGSIQGINERVDRYLLERFGRTLGRNGHSAVALIFMLLTFLLSSWGIINLVDKGYGTMAWGFLIVYLIPLFTIGAWEIARLTPSASATGTTVEPRS